MNQSFSEVLIEGMKYLSDNRIKYPSLTVKQTALMYISLYLKAMNTNQSEYVRTKHNKRLIQVRFMFNTIVYKGM